MKFRHLIRVKLTSKSKEKLKELMARKEISQREAIWLAIGLFYLIDTELREGSTIWITDRNGSEFALDFCGWEPDYLEEDML